MTNKDSRLVAIRYLLSEHILDVRTGMQKAKPAIMSLVFGDWGPAAKLIAWCNKTCDKLNNFVPTSKRTERWKIGTLDYYQSLLHYLVWWTEYVAGLTGVDSKEMLERVKHGNREIRSGISEIPFRAGQERSFNNPSGEKTNPQSKTRHNSKGDRQPKTISCQRKKSAKGKDRFSPE